MLPTEFSAYIKQKAQQKQTSIGGIELKTQTSPSGEPNDLLNLQQKLAFLGQISPPLATFNQLAVEHHQPILNQFNTSFNQQLNLNDMIMFEQQNKNQYDKFSLSLPSNYNNFVSNSSPLINNNSVFLPNVGNANNEAFYQPFESIVNSTIQDITDDDFGLNSNFAENSKTNNLISQLNKMSIDFATGSLNTNTANSMSS